MILADILRKLPAAGPLGFEGLIADLLSYFTGRRFHLAQSGTQEGRDMSSRHPSANVTAVECKRYRSNTDLDERELLGEIVQATMAIPDLDLWVLVASRDVSSQLREALRRATYDRGVELLIISDGDASPSSLAVLCAHAPAIVVASVQQHLPEAVPHLQELLVQIAAVPEYEERRAYLRNALITPLLGYDNWRAEQNHMRYCKGNGLSSSRVWLSATQTRALPIGSTLLHIWQLVDPGSLLTGSSSGYRVSAERWPADK